MTNTKVMAKAVMFGVMNGANFQFMDEEQKAEFIKRDLERRTFLYGSVSKVKLGDMEFALIPVELIIPNKDYQRIFTIDYEKVDELAEQWNGKLAGVITVAPIPGENLYEVIDGWHRVCAAKLKGIKFLAARIIELPEDQEERLLAAVEIFANQGTDPLSKADRFNAEVRRGTREYVNVANAIAGKKYLISNQIIKNEPDEEKKREYQAEWSVITGLSGLLEAGATSAGEIVVRQVLNVIEKANWTQKKNGLSGDIIRTIYKLLNLHGNDPEYADGIARYISDYEPDLFQANARSKYPLRRRLERQMMLLEIETSKILGIEPLYIGGHLTKYSK